MKPTKENQPDKTELKGSEHVKTKKLAMENQQKRALSELGKTVAELKNGIYKLDRLPED